MSLLKDIKKDLSYFLITILGLIGVLAAELLPTLELSGPWLIFMGGIFGASSLLLRKIIVTILGEPEEEIALETKSAEGIIGYDTAGSTWHISTSNGDGTSDSSENTTS